MGQPFSSSRSVYCARPMPIRLRSFESIVWRYSSARGAAHLELAHVAHVEDAGVLAHRAVLGDHAFVLHRHLPAREWNHPGPGCQVPVVERSAAEGLGRVHPEAQSIHAFPGGSALRHRGRVNRRGASSNPSARVQGVGVARAARRWVDLDEAASPVPRPQLLELTPTRLRPEPGRPRYDGETAIAASRSRRDPSWKNGTDRGAREAAHRAVQPRPRSRARPRRSQRPPRRLRPRAARSPGRR